TKLIEDAINHDGFSFVNVFSPCVTYNKVNTYDWFKEHLTSIEDIENYDPTDKQLAMKTVLEHESLVKGIVYQDTTTPSYESQIEELDESALTKRDIRLSEQEFNDLTAQFV
ncbi:MAG: 2-oxoacid:ferredoxin oxidoreductase subunit beta, partial [Staphylococcus sp.]|nr:2-oxoacid:ferredoxin oxidoreductase subunit beta [Staphylococcus sp.]